MSNDDPAPAAGTPSQPPTSSPGTESLDFDKAAYAEPSATKTCVGCRQGVPSEYYEVGGQVICGRCRNQLVGAVPDRWVFLRALLYGGLVGAAGTLLWSLIIHLTGHELGLIAILVGIGVGIAVRKGSRGRGGWKYQALAMVLTYVSITTSYVPIIVKGMVKRVKDQTTVAATQTRKDSSQATAAAEGASTPGKAGPGNKTSSEQGSLPLPIALVAFVALVWGLALAAPFLAGASNIMGLIIIAIGLYEAWKYNRRLRVNGPFKIAPAAPVEPAGTGSP